MFILSPFISRGRPMALPPHFLLISTMAKVTLFTVLCISETIPSRAQMVICQDQGSPLLSARPRWPILLHPLP